MMLVGGQLMRAITRTQAGSIARSTVPVPVPKAGELLLRVAACRLEPADLAFPNAPASIVGCGVVGRVMAVGDEVPAWRLGDRVVVDPELSRSGSFPARLGYEADGGLAEWMVVSAWAAVPVADEALADAHLALLPTYYGRAERALILGRLYPGERVLVRGADQGSGPAAVERAACLGAEIVSEEVSREPGLARAEVDLVLDFRAGRLGESDGPWTTGAKLYVSVDGTLKRQGHGAISVARHTDAFLSQALEKLVRAAQVGSLRFPDTRCFSFDQMESALASMKDGRNDRQVVVTLRSDDG